ncbi:MAG: DUF2666 family protein [archaeon]
MADEIRFEANIGNWVCVKKHKSEAGEMKIELARALASIHDSMDRKVWEYLGEEFPLEDLNKVAYEITGATYNEKKKTWEVKGRKTDAQIGEALAKCSSLTSLKNVKLPENKQAPEIAKAYLTRKVLGLLGVRMELDPETVQKYIDEKTKPK